MTGRNSSRLIIFHLPSSHGTACVGTFRIELGHEQRQDTRRNGFHHFLRRNPTEEDSAKVRSWRSARPTLPPTTVKCG